MYNITMIKYIYKDQPVICFGDGALVPVISSSRLGCEDEAFASSSQPSLEDILICLCHKSLLFTLRLGRYVVSGLSSKINTLPPSNTI